METEEKITYINNFGTVTDKRIIINYKTGTEEIPIGQISSVAFLHKRNYFFSIGGFAIVLLGIIEIIANLERLSGVAVLIIILFIIFAFLSGFANWIGHHTIVISTAGKNRKPLKVEFSKTHEGRQFVDAVKKAIFK